ncbi:MAG: DUF86 domain-containing protein [Bacteroides sp.]|nr:DUF86 domain-containing protein [Bacteroides sp.]MCM1085288.1 DUF86 domain-containing protein [Bacteroides sp.]
MREPLKDNGRLEHILAAIHRLEQYANGKTLADIEHNDMMYYAVVKNIEIIGEAAYMLSKEFTDSHTDTPWRSIVKMRHVLVHGYYQVEAAEIWAVIENDLPLLKTQIERYLTE